MSITEDSLQINVRGGILSNEETVTSKSPGLISSALFHNKCRPLISAAPKNGALI